MHWYWQHLTWDQYTSFSSNFYQSYGTWFTPKFCFCSISSEQIDRISSNFKYAFILTKSSLLQSMSLHWCQNLFLLIIFRFSCLVSLELGLFISWKRCIGATARFSDNSSFTWIFKIFFTLHVFKPFCTFAWLIILDNNHRVMLTHPFALHRNPFVPVFKCSFSSQWENKTL